MCVCAVGQVLVGATNGWLFPTGARPSGPSYTAAVIDMHVCSQGVVFMGSRMSTMSAHIALQRHVHGRTGVMVDYGGEDYDVAHVCNS
jgi:hypothetical protein